MTKRADGKFRRHHGDFYATTHKAFLPLIPFLNKSDIISEPCCGAGDLVAMLQMHGYCVPYQTEIMNGQDALQLTLADVPLATMFVTNPPWSREILHPMIKHLSDMLPTWLLFDADWHYTRQAIPYMRRCRAIVAVGRVKWFVGTKHQGFDNAAWYFFTRDGESPPRFFWRNYAST